MLLAEATFTYVPLPLPAFPGPTPSLNAKWLPIEPLERVSISAGLSFLEATPSVSMQAKDHCQGFRGGCDEPWMLCSVLGFVGRISGPLLAVSGYVDLLQSFGSFQDH